MNINQDTTTDRHLFRDSIVNFKDSQEKKNWPEERREGVGQRILAEQEAQLQVALHTLKMTTNRRKLESTIYIKYTGSHDVSIFVWPVRNFFAWYSIEYTTNIFTSDNYIMNVYFFSYRLIFNQELFYIILH